MPNFKASVRTKLDGLRKYKKELRGHTETSKRILKRWEQRYAGFLHARFVRFSKGGGDWRVVKRRRRRGQRGRISRRILYVTGTLLGALKKKSPGPGALRKFTRWTVTVGYGGRARHPGGKVTVADLASFHQVGAGTLPIRKVIVRPNSEVIKGFERDADRELSALSLRTRILDKVK